MTDQNAPSPSQALVIHPGDNVAVMTVAGIGGQTALIRRPGPPLSLVLRADAPFGHKIAIVGIAKGEPVRKYGEPIAIAAVDIAAGEHVHIHNVVGLNADLRG